MDTIMSQQALEKGAVAAVVRKDQLPRFTDQNAPAGGRRYSGRAADSGDRSAASFGESRWSELPDRRGRPPPKKRSPTCSATRFRVLKSEGNFNNHFGLPLMLLKLEPEHDMAVIEMGMSHAGEIRALAKIAQPEIGVVTNVAPVHLEFFDSIAGIARAKYELIESLPPVAPPF